MSKELIQLSIKAASNTQNIAEIQRDMATKKDFQTVMENFIDPKAYRHFLILNGEKIEADLAYTGIYARAKHSIYIVDDDIGIKTLHLLSSASDNVSIIVFSDHVSSFGITASIIADFRSECPSLLHQFPKNNAFVS